MLQLKWLKEATYRRGFNIRPTGAYERLGFHRWNHGLIPGWELPKISQSKYHLSKSYGIASDYFAEALHSMRKESLAQLVSRHVEFSDNFKIRDERAVKRMASGLIKLLFPNESFDMRELKLVLDIALEYRQRVRDWLHKIAPGEFLKERLEVRVRG